MAKHQSDPRIDQKDRAYGRELAIVAAIVAVVILVGAVYTLINGPRPTEGAGGTVVGVEAERTPSGALRPAEGR